MTDDVPWWVSLDSPQEKEKKVPGKDIQKWADEAMFKAEDMPEEALKEPRVHLLWMTPDPLGAAAAMNAMYTGKVKRSLADVTRAEREALLDDMMATALKAPFEAIKLHFLIEGVTRGFTHQLVRQRTAVYAQESTRFAVFGDGVGIPVGLPPSLHGTESLDDFLVGGAGESPEAFETAMEMASSEQRARVEWDEFRVFTEHTYNRLIEAGMPAEDARGILPTNLLTRIHYVTDLRNLHAHAGLRLSTQAQFEWRMVWKGFIEAIRNYDPLQSVRLSYMEIKRRQGAGATPETRRTLDALAEVGYSDSWQYEAISEIFRPICYYTGKCEFMASADRHCNIRDRVQANHSIGRPSSEWHEPFVVPKGSVTSEEEIISAIHPLEWLGNPAAARRAPGSGS